MSTEASEAIGRPFQHDVVVLLVDDQPMVGEGVRRMLLPHTDISFHYCRDPKQAVARAVELRPTVILQDLIMPEVDGLDLVLEYRREASTKYTPLIVLSTREEADTKAEAFSRGANDYLVKLPDPVELVARIRYHSRGYIALLERHEAYSALARSQQALQDELNKAADYVRSLLPGFLERPVKTDWRFIPSASLGGDAFDYQWLDDYHFAIYLLDVCGHGVGSALLSISAINTLRSRTLPDTDFTDPSEVLAGLNRAFPMERQNYMFFTMWYGVYEVHSRTLTYSGAGHPPALYLPQGRGSELVPLESESPMVGVEDHVDFFNRRRDVAEGDHLFVYSDGVFEVSRSDGRMWTLDDFLAFMRGSPEVERSPMDRLLAHTRQLQGKESFGDDFSIVQVVF